MAIVIKLAREYNIPYIRVVNEQLNLSKGRLLRQIQLVLLNFLSQLAANRIKKAGLKCNDYFIGFINAGEIGESDIRTAKQLAQKYPDKIIELGCHPGYENTELKTKYSRWGNYNWGEEFKLLNND